MANPFQRPDATDKELEDILSGETNKGRTSPPPREGVDNPFKSTRAGNESNGPFGKPSGVERPNPFKNGGETEERPNPFKNGGATEERPNPFKSGGAPPNRPNPPVNKATDEDEPDLSRKGRGLGGPSPVEERFSGGGNLRDELNVPRREGRERQSRGEGQRPQRPQNQGNSGGGGFNNPILQYIGISSGAIIIIVLLIFVAGFTYNFYSNYKQQQSLARAVGKVSNFHVTGEDGLTQTVVPGNTVEELVDEVRYLDFTRVNRNEIRVFIDEYTSEVINRRTSLKSGKIEAIVKVNPKTNQIRSLEYLGIVE